MRIRAGRPTAVLALCMLCFCGSRRRRRVGLGRHLLVMIRFVYVLETPVIGEGGDGVDFARSLGDIKYGVFRCEEVDCNCDEAALSRATQKGSMGDRYGIPGIRYTRMWHARQVYVGKKTLRLKMLAFTSGLPRPPPSSLSYRRQVQTTRMSPIHPHRTANHMYIIRQQCTSMSTRRNKAHKNDSSVRGKRLSAFR